MKRGRALPSPARIRLKLATTLTASLACGLAMTGLATGQAEAGTTPAAAPALGGSANGGAVIVVMANQYSSLNLRTQGAQRQADAFADQAPLVADIRASGGTGVQQLVSVNAIAATVSADEVAQLRTEPGVARIIPDITEQLLPQQADAPDTMPASQVSGGGAQPACPSIPGEPGKPAQEPEADVDIHASTGNPHSPDMANSIATGKGVVVAIAGMNELAGNPNFTRADGSPVVVDAPDPTLDQGNDESYGDASSVAAQGTVVYQYSKALPFSNISPKCTFVIKGDAPDATLVDSTEIDTPGTPEATAAGATGTTTEASLVAEVDNAVITEHADVISESVAFTPRPGSYAIHYTANDAAVAAGVTVVVSSDDSGVSGTVSPPATDPLVIAAGAVDTFRLVAVAHNYTSWVNNNIAALSSGGTTPNNKLVDLVAPGYFGGEAACAENVGGCPPGNPTESMRGTSESAPLIAGAAADVIQAYRDSHAGASPTPEQVKELLSSTATDIDAPADEQGSGLVNVYAAVKAAQQMPGATGHAAGDSALIASPSQLDLSGNGGTVNETQVQLYNTSSKPVTVTGASRVLGPERQIASTVTENISAPDPSLPVPPEGAKAANTIRFTVPRGLDRLDADMIWPDPTNSNIICFALFDPQGRLVQLSYDDPTGRPSNGIGSVPNIQHAEVSNPEPGRWTARILWSGQDLDLALAPAVPGTYTGPMSFKVSGANYLTTRATSPVRIGAHATATVPLRVVMPSAPGDHPESVQFAANDGAHTSLPVARRTLIPSGGGAFQTLITGTVGRVVGQISTYDINVPAGKSLLDVSFSTADASPDNPYTFFLVDPSGAVAAMDTTPKTVNGESVATADVQAADPAAGTWEIDVELNLTESGNEFTQTVFGKATLN